MGRRYIITILFLLLTAGLVYPQEIDSSRTTALKPVEDLELLPDQFHFLHNDNPESTSISTDQIDLDQLLNSYSVYPTLEFNLTDKIRSENKNKTVILWGGVVPFFSIPDPYKRDEESNLSKDSFSIFWHLKKKF